MAQSSPHLHSRMHSDMHSDAHGDMHTHSDRGLVMKKYLDYGGSRLVFASWLPMALGG